ncbi:MAG TPA: hypothetical protein VMG10_10550 [Gemmataceae bacterium]|nr:hypothetical protein [Gemmataceae bacterium]
MLSFLPLIRESKATGRAFKLDDTDVATAFLRFLQAPPFLLPGNLEIAAARSAGNFEVMTRFIHHRLSIRLGALQSRIIVALVIKNQDGGWLASAILKVRLLSRLAKELS